MQNTSYIIPYRAGDDPDRRANLEAVLTWLRPLAPGRVIVVEQDIAPTLGDLPLWPALQVQFTYGPGPFNKSWAMNVGYRAAETPVLAFGDADVIGPGLVQAVAAVREGVPVVRAYARVLDLDAAASRRLRGDPAAIAAPGFAADAPPREQTGEIPPSCGGIVVLQRAIFELLGGWDERFEGWGGEDDAMDHKLARAGIRPGIVAGALAYHLHHHRDRAADSPLYRNNLALLAQLRAMPEEALRRMCEVTLQLIGNPEMYRPLERLE